MNRYFTKKRLTSLLLTALMVIGMVPGSAFGALAEGTAAPADSYPCAHHTAHDAACGYGEGAPCGYTCPICPVQAMIDALPDAVTAENAEDVAARLGAIDEAKKGLTDDQTALLDTARYVAAAAALGSVYAPAPAADYECWYYDANGQKAYSSSFATVLASKAAHDEDGNAGWGTIYILKNITVTSTINNIQGTGLTIESDGGNFGITCTSGTAIEMISGSSLTLNNVDVTAAGSSGQAISVPTSATLTLNSGCYIESNTDSGVYVSTGGKLYVNSGAIIRGAAGVTAHGDVTVTGGSIGGRSTDGLQLYIYGTLNMSGGEIYGSSGGAGVVVGSNYDSQKMAKATVTGGTVSTNNSTGAAVTGYGAFNVSGSAVVTGGTGMGTKQVTIVGALTEAADIRFMNTTVGATVAAGSGYTPTAADAAQFSSYSTNYEAALSGSTVVVAAAIPAGSVASVTVDGSTKYFGLLDSAFYEVAPGKTGTVTLLKDVEVDSTILLGFGRNITFNGGGHTVSLTSEATCDIFSVVGATLTLNDVSIIVDYYSYGASALNIGTAGTVTVNSGAKLNGGGSDVAVYVGEGGTLILNEGGEIGGQEVWGGGISNWYGTVNINGGSVEGVNAAAINNCGDSTSVLNITGGTVTCTRSGGGTSDYVLYNRGKATITGGTFVQNSTYAAFDLDAPVDISGNVIIRGGGINSAVNVIGPLGADAKIPYTATDGGVTIANGSGYTLTQSDADKFKPISSYVTHALDTVNNTVVTDRYAAAVTIDGSTQYFLRFEDALACFDKNVSGGTLKLLENVTLSAYDPDTYAKYTLDLNGYTLTVEGTFGWASGGNLTIKDSSYSKNGKLVCAEGITLNYPLTVEGGTIDAAITVNEGGYLTVKDGKLSKPSFTVSGGQISIEGGTFVGGISVTGSTLASLLASGKGYYQGGSPLQLTDGQTSVTGGNVTIGEAVTFTDKLATLYVGSTCVVENKVVKTASGEGWSFDADTGVLTLTDANIDTTYAFGSNTYGIYADGGALTINTVGKNTVTGGTHGIHSNVLSIGGSGCLTLGGTSYSIYTTQLTLGTSTHVVAPAGKVGIGGDKISLSPTTPYYVRTTTAPGSFAENGDVTKAAILAAAYFEYVGGDMGDNGHLEYISNGYETHILVLKCDNNRVVLIEDCSGGTATCTQKAVCKVCGYEYGELTDHTYGENGHCTLCNAQALVSVTTSGGVTVYYSTVEEAVAAANRNAGCTVKLLQDAEAPECIEATKSWTLDLNGNTLSCAEDFLDDLRPNGTPRKKVLLSTSNSAGTDLVLTLTDTAGGGVLDGTGTSDAIFFSRGQIIIEGGTVLGQIEVRDGATLTLKGGKLTQEVRIYRTAAFNMSGGEIAPTGSGNGSAIYVDTEGTVSISGGKITAGTGVHVANHDGAAVSISGGTFDCESDFAIGTGNTLTLTGGEFIDGIKGDDDYPLNTILGKAADGTSYAYYLNGVETSVEDDAFALGGAGDTVTVKLHSHSYTNGFCPCGKYEAPTGSGTASDPYLIANAGQLYWFYEVTSTADGYDGVAKNSAAHAKLTADIDTNPGTYVYEGTMTGSAFPRPWSPIEFYSGTFDGDGHTVRGLYCRGRDACGLFGTVQESGTVKNLGVIHSIFDSGNVAGSIAPYNYGTVSNCFTSDSAVHGRNQVGGIVGYNHGVISRCGNSGAVINDGDSGNNAGGIAGCNYGKPGGGIIIDCYNRGSVTLTSGENLVGGIAGANSNGRIINCYNTGAVSAYNGESSAIAADSSGDGAEVVNCYYLLDDNVVGVNVGNEKVNTYSAYENDFTSGRVTWLLNEEETDDPVWKQTLDGESYPGFAGGTVYRCVADCRGNMGYSNTNSSTAPPHSFTDGVCTNKLVDGSTCGYACPHDSYENHICTVCGMPCAHEEYTDGVCDDCGLICTHDSVTGSECDECSCLIQASLTMNGATTYYISAQDAVEAAKQSTDKSTTLKLLSDVVTTADDGLVIWRGTFTIDLAGRTLSGAVNGIEVSNADITVIDSGTGGRISGSQGIYATNANVTFAGGTVTGYYAISLNGSDLTVSGGSVEGTHNAVSFSGGSVYVTGGSLEGGSKVFYNNTYRSMDVPVLSGGTFPNGISAGRAGVDDPAVNELLADGYRYWQDGNLLYVSELAASINGAVTVAPCDHSDGIPNNYTDNLDGTHTGVYNCCGLEAKEGHLPQYYTDDTAGTITQKCCYCGGDELVFTLVIPTGAVYGDPALAVPHFECSDESYTGEYPVITVDGKTLADFVPAAGTYDVAMTLGGRTVSGDYTISPKALTEDDVTVALSSDSFVYNGEAQMPTVTVKLGDKTLVGGLWEDHHDKEDSDFYIVLPYDDVSAGEKQLGIVFQNNYSGEIMLSYNITPATLTVYSAAGLDKEYDRTDDISIVSVNIKGIVPGDEVAVIVDGLHGSLRDSDAGTYTDVLLPGGLRLTGADAHNYELEQPTDYVPLLPSVTVSAIDLNGATVEAAERLTYTGDELTNYVISVTTKDGEKLPLGLVQISGDTATPVGRYILTVEGVNDNVKGKAEFEWLIWPADITHLTVDNVTSADEDLIREVKRAAENGDTTSLTPEEREQLYALVDKCDDLLERIDDAFNSANTDNVGDAGPVTPDNVTEDDRDALQGAIDDLEDALDKYEGNYTEDEKKIIEDFIEEKQAALDVLDDVADLKERIENLPDPDTVEPDDVDVLNDYLDAKEIYNNLNENGKGMITEDEKLKLDETASALVAYKLTKGDGSTWQKDSGKTLTFTANGAYSKFISVKVDGAVIDPANYTAVAGSTVITLKAEYLQTLRSGRHSISVTYPDGEAKGSFTVKAPALPEGTPDTGDNAKPWLWGVLAAAAIGAIAVVIVAGSKNKKRK